MVSLLSHLLIAASLYLILNLKKKLNTANFLFCMLFTIILDVDFIIYLLFKIGNDYLYHRIFFHNILAFILFAFFVYLFNLRLKKRYFSNLDFAVFYGLHILLDLFDNGVPLFYPFSDKFFLIAQIGDYIGFPLKLVYEGNIYFSALVIFLYTSALSFFVIYRKWMKTK